MQRVLVEDSEDRRTSEEVEVGESDINRHDSYQVVNHTGFK